MIEDQAKRRRRPSPRGVGRGGTRARGPRGRAKRNSRPRLKGSDEPWFGPEAEEFKRAGARAQAIADGSLCLL